MHDDKSGCAPPPFKSLDLPCLIQSNVGEERSGLVEYSHMKWYSDTKISYQGTSIGYIRNIYNYIIVLYILFLLSNLPMDSAPLIPVFSFIN